MRQFNGVYSCGGAFWVDMGVYLMLPALNAGATAFLTAFQCSFVCPVSMFSPPRNCNTCTADSAFMIISPLCRSQSGQLAGAAVISNCTDCAFP